MGMPRGVAWGAAVVVLATSLGAHLHASIISPDTYASNAVFRFHAALKAGDRETVLSLLDESVVIYEEGGAELSRAEYAKEHLDADMAFAAATTTEIVRRSSGWSGELAWVITQGRIKGRFRGRDVDRLTTETAILKGTATSYRIVHIHWSSKPVS
jgi:ketosteroid isomerase-like protein